MEQLSTHPCYANVKYSLCELKAVVARQILLVPFCGEVLDMQQTLFDQVDCLLCLSHIHKTF